MPLHSLPLSCRCRRFPHSSNLFPVLQQHSQAFSVPFALLLPVFCTMATAPASGAAAVSTGPGPSAPSPAPGHAALPPVSDVLAELLTFPDETLWPALRDLVPEDLMRMHDLLGSAFADRLGLTPLRFQNPPPEPDVDMESKPVPPAAPDANMSGPPAAGSGTNATSDLLGLDEDGAPAPTTVPDYTPPEPGRRSGYAEGGQEHWNPAWLRQLDPSGLPQESYEWVDVQPPLPRAMADNGPWSNREGWRIRVCSHFPMSPQTIHRPGYWPFADLFCIRPADHPSWLERQLPPQPVQHLPVRGYCSHVCDRFAANTHGFRCVGLCLRPVMYGERAPHEQHTCINCLKGH